VVVVTLVAGLFVLVSSPHILLQTFALIAKPSPTFQYSKMVQIKLSIAFVLAAAAIAPIVAHPIPEFEAGHEHDVHVGLHHHRHHHTTSEREHADEVDNFSGSHHHDHQHEQAGHQGYHHHFKGPQDLSTDSNTPPPSPREYVEEFEVRDLLLRQNGNPNLLNFLESEEKTLLREDASLLRQHQALQHEDIELEHKNRHLKHKEIYLEHKDHHLESEDRKLKHERNSLESQDKSLDDRKHRLENENKKLSATDKVLSLKDKVLSAKDRKLALKGKDLSLKNKALAKDGTVLAHKDRALKLKGKVLSQKDKLLEWKGKVLAHDDKVLAQKGKVLAHNNDALTQKGNVLENKVRSQAGKVPLGHGPVVHSKPEIVAREYAEFDDMFERDLEGIEFDARDFDSLYLD